MDKRIEKSNRSVLALKKLLSEICLNPEKYVAHESIIKALKSQGAFSKFVDDTLGIFPTSINTIKRVSENLINGGFQALDASRIAAQIALEKELHKSKNSNRQSRAGLVEAKKNLEIELQTLRQDLLLISLAFEKALRQSARYAEEASPATLARCKKEQRELLDLLSLRVTPIDAKVIKLHEK